MSPVHHDRSADAAIAALESVPAPGAADQSGVAAGYRPGKTLPFGVELRRQLKRRRTQFTLGFMVLLPVILAIAFAFGDPAKNRSSNSARASIVDLAQNGAGNFAMVTLIFAASFLLIVVISLFFGDTIASEASWSSLRYLLALPVPRIRLVRQKVLVAGALSLTAILLLPVTALLLGGVLYGFGPLQTPVGDQLTLGATVARLAIVVAFLAIQLTWVAGLAFLLSVSTDAPLGAVGGAVLLTILSQILDQIDALGGIRDWLPTHYAFAWTGTLSDPIRWDDMIRGGFAGLGYALILFGFGVMRFRRKDITS
ncbi:ABC transporter permease [Nakamurella antarctica]|uniref:ABC transporter permease n=1 Tax=Nakamurella antarctica TaxID=1902245 RepID=A0A3G8ZKR1_9ACTN|nr:ABC transporter permease [Nakamurella antarctica]AZI57902.1 ABC transporter permease [Nakamurella antarctica]